MSGKVLAFQRLHAANKTANQPSCVLADQVCTKHDCDRFEPVNLSRSRSYVDILEDGTVRYSLRVQDRSEILRLISACQTLQDRLLGRLSACDPD